MTEFDPLKQFNDDALEKAQNLVYDAWDTQSTKKKIALANQALKISPFCADAYILLGNTSQSIETSIQYYEQAVHAGKQSLGLQYFTDFKGSFWSLIETRPYMRACAELARALWLSRRNDDSIQYSIELLELNPQDHQGIRYVLASHLLATKKYQELHTLLDQYDDDAEATWPYTKLLLELIEYGNTQRAVEYFTIAIENNHYIPNLLINPQLIPTRIPKTISMGGEDQAIHYAKHNIDLWQECKEAIDWLKDQMDKVVVPLVIPIKQDCNELPSSISENKTTHQKIQDHEKEDINLNAHNNITSLVDFKKNKLSDDDFLGLSPHKMHNLLYYPFDSKDIVSFNLSINVESPFTFLYQKLSESLIDKGAKATVKGNLPLKICQNIHTQFNNPFDYFDTKVRTESDFFELHIVRLIAGIAGLIKKQKGYFTLTKKGLKLQSKESSGELHFTLFKVYVEKFNWGYWDRYPDCSIVQMSALFQLYALQKKGFEWHDDAYYEYLFLRAYPSVLSEFKDTQYSSSKEQAARVFNLRAIQRFLYLFGFIETQKKDPEKKSFNQTYRIRKTSLVDEYISFKP